MEERETPTAREPLSIGDRVLDRYEVVERLERGGHSIVYRGLDERLCRPVCIKVFHKLVERPEVWLTTYEHFVQEAFALSRLSHPNTLRIYDFGHLEPTDERRAPFQVSEFMNGGTLSALVRARGPLSRVETSRIVVGLAGALAEAHQYGIVHRDIKPTNILFGTAGPAIPKLADFGIAKSYLVSAEQIAHQAEDTEVVAGRPLLMYSPNWAAPEQMTSQPIGYGADIYSLALIAVFMVTGEALFAHRDPTESFLIRRQSDDLIDAALARHGLSGAVATLLKRACRSDPDERPTSVSEFGSEFAEALLDTAETELAVPHPRVKLTSIATDRHQAPLSTPPLHHLRVAEDVHEVGSRRVYFAPMAQGVADLIGRAGTTRIRISWLPLAASGFGVHVKGLNCFVARLGERPSPAIQLQSSATLECSLANLSKLAIVSVSFGNPAAGHRIFDVAGHPIAVSHDECPAVVGVDFGPGTEYVLVYQPPPLEPKPVPTRRRFPATRSRS